MTLGAEGVCPAPDLVIATTPESLAAYREARVFDPAIPRDACAIEKGCVGGPGKRQLLRFTADVRNAGDADLILGVPDATTSGFETAACDGQAYFKEYMRYELVTLEGTVVATGQMQARCPDLPPGFRSRFSCELLGLWSGFTDRYAPGDVSAEGDYRETLCQWIDITDVSAGDYQLRIQVNPNGVIAEQVDNNLAEFPITVPNLTEPLQACIDGIDPFNTVIPQRECGWERSALQQPASCTPGESVTLECLTCTGDPMLRVCEGLEVCTDIEALGWGDDAAELLLTNGETREGECYFDDPSVEECLVTSDCPVVQFVCPASGGYSWLQSTAPIWTGVASTCDVSVRNESAADDAP